jgi:hypothetical protein
MPLDPSIARCWRHPKVVTVVLPIQPVGPPVSTHASDRPASSGRTPWDQPVRARSLKALQAFAPQGA